MIRNDQELAVARERVAQLERLLEALQNHVAAKRTLLYDVRGLIEETRSIVAAAVNVGLTMLNWRIGKRINEAILKGERASYGEEIVTTLSRQLIQEYGDGFSTKNLRHMTRFAEAFSDERIVSTLWRQLSWSHFKEIIYLEKPMQRDFYAEMCRLERWRCCSGTRMPIW